MSLRVPLGCQFWVSAKVLVKVSFSFFSVLFKVSLGCHLGSHLKLLSGFIYGFFRFIYILDW